WCVMLLWAIVALRLVIPVSIESAFSLIPRGMDEKIESIEAAVIDRNTDQEKIPQAEANNMPGIVTGDIQEDVTYIPYEIVEITEPVKQERSIFEIAGYIWIAGVALMLMFSLVSYIKLKLRMAESVKYKDNIYLSDRTATAFILGIIRPRIYLSSGIDKEEIPYVIAHEYSHIKRGDHFWKPLAYLLLCIYWFNPLMWLAYSLLSRDIEYACDEKTVSGYDMKDRKAYAAALLENSIQKKLVMVCPLAFWEGSIKERVRKVLDHKKPAFWICIVSLAVVAIIGICFATKPKNDGDTVAQEEAGDITEDELLAKSQETGNNAELVTSQNIAESETPISIVDETEDPTEKEPDNNKNYYHNEAISYPKDVIAEDKGIKVSLVEAAADNYSIVMNLRIEGATLDENERILIRQGQLLIDGEEISSIGGELIKAESGDYYEFTVPFYADLFSMELLGKNVEVVIKSFAKALHPEKNHIDEIETIAEGNWDINWIAEGNGYLCASSSDYEFKNGGILDGITMTALRLELEYNFPKQEIVKKGSDSDWMTSTWTEYVYPPIPVAYLMEDGSIRRLHISAPGKSGYPENDEVRQYTKTETNNEVFVYSHATNIVVDPHEVSAILFLDKNSEYIGKDEEYGVPELPLEEYEMVSFRAPVH
ncbi:MAG: M56 family metallopeptidase, partial [Lachnospiraceae bacterium]|nr:M56 family metallopeptidase [Lachnospiraceae bacterium]